MLLWQPPTRYSLVDWRLQIKPSCSFFSLPPTFYIFTQTKPKTLNYFSQTISTVIKETTMSAPGTPVSKLASQASSAEPSPAIQALHQAQNALAPRTLEMQRQLLQQKLAEQKNVPFTSPTDDMMTPCSKKLQNVKSKSFAKSVVTNNFNQPFKYID